MWYPMQFQTSGVTITRFTVTQIPQVSSTWIRAWGHLSHTQSSMLLKMPCHPDPSQSMKRINYKLTRIIMTEHLMLWIVSYTFLEMSTNWLSSNRCTVLLLKVSNAIFTWLINSGITIKKKLKISEHKRDRTCNFFLAKHLALIKTLFSKKHYSNSAITFKWEYIYSFITVIKMPTVSM